MATPLAAAADGVVVREARFPDDAGTVRALFREDAGGSPARRLHASLGFVDCAPYVYNPIPTARYLERLLPAAGGTPLR